MQCELTLHSQERQKRPAFGIRLSSIRPFALHSLHSFQSFHFLHSSDSLHSSTPCTGCEARLYPLTIPTVYDPQHSFTLYPNPHRCRCPPTTPLPYPSTLPPTRASRHVHRILHPVPAPRARPFSPRPRNNAHPHNLHPRAAAGQDFGLLACRGLDSSLVASLVAWPLRPCPSLHTYLRHGSLGATRTAALSLSNIRIFEMKSNIIYVCAYPLLVASALLKSISGSGRLDEAPRSR
jgi:hypothetical protein